MTCRPTAAGLASGRTSWLCWGSRPPRCSASKSLPGRSPDGCWMLVSSLVLFGGVYIGGLIRVWRNAGFGRGVRPIEALAFAAGWLALLLALSPRLDEWSEQWLAVHMVQHELL